MNRHVTIVKGPDSAMLRGAAPCGRGQLLESAKCRFDASLRLAACATALSVSGHRPTAATGEKHLLYAAVPGIRNYLDYGGIGLLVYDMDDGHRLVRRIPTFALEPGSSPRTSRGSPPTPQTGRIYVSTIRRVAAFDLATDKMVWNRTYEGAPTASRSRRTARSSTCPRSRGRTGTPSTRRPATCSPRS